ncbi:MAG TPA: hypothetical protein VKC51_00195 [Lacunisphaera sp.]|nr:hypothetical protein [Lacunisphaera sp.]
MNRFEHQWQKLTTLARAAGEPRDTTAPYGFATRLAARAATVSAPWAPFERFALRGLMVAGVLGLTAVAFDYTEIMSDSTDDLALTDTIGEMLDLS